MLTSTEIQKLFDFTRKKRVRFIDVQIELVDHLASSIEELRSNDPTLSFEAALQKVYAKYPFTGFNKLINEKTKALYIFFFRKFKDYLISFLTWPKVLWFILIFMILFVLSSSFESVTFYRIFLVISVLLILFEGVENLIFGRDKMSKYLSLCTYYGFNFCITMVSINLLYQSKTFDSYILTGKSQIITCILLSIYLISLYALYIVFPRQIKQDVLREYGEFASHSKKLSHQKNNHNSPS